MKQFIFGFLTVIILAVILWLIFKPDFKPPDNSRETELLQNIEQLKSDITILKAKNDSLETVKQRTRREIIYRTAQIDSSIAKDSSNSLVEYRRSLQDNNYLPDGTLYLSYREIGLGAILMSKIPKLQLQLSICEEQSFNKDVIIADQEYIIEGKDDLIEIKDNNIEYYKDLYDDSNTFWSSTEFGIIIGVTASAILVFASGALK